MTHPRTGSCLCGTIRYTPQGKPAKEGASHCHCRNCRRSTGAPIEAWPKGPVKIDITLASLDDPAKLPPTYYILTSSQLP